MEYQNGTSCPSSSTQPGGGEPVDVAEGIDSPTSEMVCLGSSTRFGNAPSMADEDEKETKEKGRRNLGGFFLGQLPSAFEELETAAVFSPS